MKKIIKILFCMLITISFVFITQGALSKTTNILSDVVIDSQNFIDSTVYNLNSPPGTPIINGTIKGTLGVTYDYTFVSIDPDGDDVYYWVRWEPGCPSVNWQGPYHSGEVITFSHTFSLRGSYSITCTAKDEYNETSEPGSLDITMPRSKAISRPYFYFIQNIFENYQNLFKLLQKKFLSQ